MNTVVLMGRLTRDPDVRYSPDNMAIARFTLAVDRRRNKDGEKETDFPACVAFGKTAEFIEKYVTQGTKLVINGELRTGSYTNKDGAKVYTTEVNVNTAEFAESKASQQAPQQSRPAQQREVNEGFCNIPDGVEDDGLPFN